MRIRGRWLLLTASALLMLPAGPLAADPLRFGISPGDLELVPGPGGTATATLLVMNHSTTRVRFTVSVADMFLRPGGELDVLPSGTLDWSVARLTRISPSEFDLEAGQGMPVRVSVTVPADARGGRYGAVIVSPSPILQSGGVRGTVSIIVPKLAARLLVPIKGTEVRNGAITNMIAVPRRGGKGADLKVVFRNSGNVHVRAAGEVTIVAASGQPVGKIQIPEALILPGTIREFRLAWEAPALDPGMYTVRAIIDYGAEVLVAGEVGFTIRK